MASPSVFIVWSTLQVWTLWFCLTVGCITCDGQFENVARNKQCNISSVYEDDQNHPASAAVNGNTGGRYESTNNCIHTKEDDYSWWEVDLGGPFPVYNITVWAREGFFRRIEKCNITVDGRHCNKIVDVKSRDINISCTSGVINGRVVRLERDFTKTTLATFDRAINMCEFQVWSCSYRYWDSGCDQVCGECRDGAPCDKVTGHCDWGCRNPGLEPPLCTQGCTDGTFGQDCKEICSNNCADVCNKVTGHCTCKPGWIFPNCVNKCDGKRYGYNCSEECGACSGGVPCHHVNGSCQSCSGNFRLPHCRPVATSSRYDDQGTEYNPSSGVPVSVMAGTVASVVAVLLLVIAILVVVILRMRTANQALEKLMAQPSEISMTVPATTDDYVNTEVTEGAAASPDLSNYDRLEVYENKKDITNVYTDLTVNTQGLK